MSELLNKQICLALNKNWMSLDFRTIKKAVSDITSINPQTGEPPFMFLDLTFAQNEDGTYDTNQLLDARPVSVEVWIGLPIRSCDLSINCGKYELRAPTIIVATNYDKVNERKPKFSPEAVRERDNHRCVVTGRALTPDEGDLGHDIARTKGGRKTWTNIGYMDRRLNRLMGTKSFEEMGWGHVRAKLKEPKGSKVLITADQIKHPSQIHFLARN